MDLLKKEMERKKKALEGARRKTLMTVGTAESDGVVPSGRGGGRFIKAGELRRMQEEQEEEMRMRQRTERERETSKSDGVHDNRCSPAPEDDDDDSKQRKKRSRRGRKRDEDVGQTGHGGTRDNEGTTKRRKIEQSSSLVGGSEEADSTGAEAKRSDPSDAATTSSSGAHGTMQSLSPDEVSRRLRLMGLPIRLFGERTVEIENDSDRTHDDAARLERLKRALADQKETLATLSEKDEYRLGSGHGIRNTFLEKDDATDTQFARAPAAASRKAYSDGKDEPDRPSDEKGVSEGKADNADPDDINDPHKRIYRFFKGLLKSWEEELANRPDDAKRTTAGKNETKTVKQCRDYIRPLFKLCKSRRLEEGLMASIVKIVDFCEQGEFVKAHDVYMDIAIGRAAWPIGVTMVGIHARSGRAKIESKNVAHVMNSELQRKYLTSLKRLMTYAQKKRDDVDPSKKVMN